MPSIFNWLKQPLFQLISVGAIALFLSSTIKHALFQSNAWDLGIFDQAVYLISQGKPAISSFLEFHILADHAAIVLYPLALLYRIYPDVHWLFAVQAIALSLGCLPTYNLARQSDLTERYSLVLAATYLLYPLVFNLSMADFHPEVFAIPFILQSVYAARNDHWHWFIFWIALALSCKAALALTIVALGIWLLIFENRRCGVIAIALGILWFLIATKLIIPTFGGEAASLDRHVFRYAYLGNSLPEMINNVLNNPGLVLGKIFSWRTIDYLLLLFAPILWAVPSLKFAPFIAAMPPFLMNILSTHAGQRNLIDQYAVPIFPFLILIAISAANWKKIPPRLILVWSILTFLLFAKYTFFVNYLEKLDNWTVTRTAIAQISPQASVLTDFRLAPHLSHRTTIKLVNSARTYRSVPLERAKEFEFILLDLRHPWGDRSLIKTWINALKSNPQFQLRYEFDEIFLFKRN